MTQLKRLLLGAGSVLNIYPVTSSEVRHFEPKLYKPAESDEEALRSDWVKIGNDMKKAMDRAQKETNR